MEYRQPGDDCTAYGYEEQTAAVMMSFQREYAESYEWLVEVFRDWAFTFFSSFLFYQDYDRLDENERNLYRQGMAAFGGVAPTYSS